MYTFTGYNSAYNNRFIKLYNDSDSENAGFVRDMHLLPQNFNVDKNTLDSIIFQFVVHSLGSFPSYFTLLFLYILSIVYHSSSLHTIICTPPLVCFSNNQHDCVRVCVCACVRALRKVTGSDSTSRQMLLLSLGDGDCRPKRGCPVSWHP